MSELEKTIDHLTRRNGFTAGALWLGTVLKNNTTREALIDALEWLETEANRYANAEAAKLTSDRVIDGLARDIAAYSDHCAEVIARHNAAYNTRMTPASIAAHPDAILHSDDSPHEDSEDAGHRAQACQDRQRQAESNREHMDRRAHS